jgi:drug/metabolite transporter (DMT)-like permease
MQFDDARDAGMLKKQKSSRQGLGVALVLFATICLSIEAVAAKLAYQGGATVMITLTLRYILAAAIFWLIIKVGKYAFRLPRRQLAAVTALSLGGQTLTVLALFESFRYIPSGMAILFLYLYPTLVAVLSVFVLREPFTRGKGIALLLTFAGCAIILGQPLNTLDMRGVILSLAAAFSNSIFLVWTTRLLKDIDTTVYNAYVMTIVALATGIIAIARGQVSFDFNLQALGAIVVLAIVSTVLAMGALLRGVKIIGASRAAIISTFEPAATALLGFLILGELLTGWQMAGGLVVLAGVFVLRGSS